MSEASVFNPDWISPPGDTISDILDAQSCSPSEFARRMDISAQQAMDLLAGRLEISAETAKRLELVVGATAEFWTVRDCQYRGTSNPPGAAPEPVAASEWLSSIPLRDLRRFGWLQSSRDKNQVATDCLKFFGVANVNAFYQTYQHAMERAAFRTSPAFSSNPVSVAAWLRRGELEASAIETAPWDSNLFRSTLKSVRGLTRKRDPNEFLSELIRECASAGVAVAVVRAPSGCRASGATRFLSSTKALLQLSFRYLSDDHFWFTFFHEAGHLLIHNHGALFLEGTVASGTEEAEANDFASRALVPPEHQAELGRLPIERHAIRNFARGIGISPGIVLGQLQHMGRARPDQLNTLKVRFKWSSDE